MSDLDRLSLAAKPQRRFSCASLFSVSAIAISACAISLFLSSCGKETPEAQMQKAVEAVDRLESSPSEKPLVSAALTAAEIESLQPKQPSSGFDPYAGPMPVVIISNSFPWADRFRWRDLRLAIYEDGEAIWNVNDSLCLHQKLSKTQLQSIEDKIASFGELSRISRYNDLSDKSDQVATGILIRLGGKAWAFLMRGNDIPLSMPEFANPLLQYLRSLSFSSGKPWTPQYAEVKVWPWSLPLQQPEAAIDWPRQFPGLDDPKTIHEQGEIPSVYSIFFGSQQVGALDSYLKSTGGNPVRMDGKVWQVAVRPIFPNEPMWEKAIALCYSAH